MTLKKSVLVIATMLLALSFASAANAYLAKYSSTKALENVERVFIYIHYIGPTSDEQELVPKPLRIENLETLIKNVYTKRFSTAYCEELPEAFKTTCQNQPIEVRRYSDYWSNTFAPSKEDGTLNVLLQVRISYYLPTNKYHTAANASIYLVQDRADEGFPTKEEISWPLNIPLIQEESEIETNLAKYFTIFTQ